MILLPSKENMLLAAREIKGGGVVAFPTETVYGLGANAFDERAVARIFQLKGRPQDNPLIVHVASAEDILTVCDQLNDSARRLASLMPAPLSVVVKKNSRLPSVVTAGLDTVAVRVPQSPIARELIRLSGCPIAAPSANASTRPSPTTAQHVFEDFKDIIILDGGATEFGLESTVVDCTTDIPCILRFGAVSPSEIAGAVGEIVMQGDPSDAPRSPGMKYRHYAPRCQMIFVEEGEAAECRARQEKEGKRVAVIGLSSAATLRFLNANDYAHGLYSALRMLEKTCDVIVAEGVREDGIGYALNNRLKKASGEIV